MNITIPLPPSLNNAYTHGIGHGRRVLTEGARAFKDEAIRLIRQCGVWCVRPSDRIAFSIDLYFPDRRRCDIDNRIKLALDAAAEALGFDDARVDTIVVRRAGIDKRNPRAEVRIEVIG